MAQKVTVLLVDDLDGGEAEESLLFGFEGVSYEIDLSSNNAKALREAMQPFVDAGRRISGRRGPAPKAAAVKMAPSGGKGARPVNGSTITVVPDRHSLKKFAESRGRHLSDRGRIPQSLLDDWAAAGSPT